MIRLFSLLTLLLSFGLTTLFAQPDFDYVDKTYLSNITTVKLNVAGFPHSYPVISLTGSAQLRLSFDDMSNEVRRYTYRIIHCNRDWTPSTLSPLEYTSGFSEGDLNDFNFSFRTLAEYIHYDLYFPNQDIEITKSGNYMLVVTDDEDDEITAITRRFMVTENIAGMSGEVNRSTAIGKIHTHQEVDFSVNTKQLKPRNPLQEISASVVQNGRWDNAIIGISPTLMRREAVLFDYQGKVSFAGGNEFRNLDIRSIAAPRADILDITNEGSNFAMVLKPERVRDQEIYLNYADLNGDFFNLSNDEPVLNITTDFRDFERLNLDFTGDYINMTFILNTGTEFEGDNVYLFGSFTEFQKKRKYKMTYNPAINSYVAKVLLKQGFYNYWFVTNQNAFGEKPEDLDFSLDRTEGNFDEAENDYLVLTYYRPLGGRYDRLVGHTILNSNFN